MDIIKNNHGFTLIEVIISILILAILMAGGMSFYHHSNDFMAMSMHKKVALEIAASELEALKSSGYNNLPALGITQLTNVGIGTTTTYTRTLSVANYPPGAPDSKELNVDVNWTENGIYEAREAGKSDMSVELTTYLSP